MNIVFCFALIKMESVPVSGRGQRNQGPRDGCRRLSGYGLKLSLVLFYLLKKY